MNTMNYKGYTAKIEFDEEDEIFVGEIMYLRKDIICFHGKSVDELRVALQETIDGYIANCIATGDKPEKPRTKRLKTAPLRLQPTV
jgi:predicted HicB family RNase H-like nuclease